MSRAAPFGFSRAVFLSHVISEAMPVFPGDPPPRIRHAATAAEHGYHMQQLSIAEQAGTHWAAPAHLIPGGAAADELDAADFFFPAAVLDVRARAGEDADFALDVAGVRRWEAGHGRVPRHAAVLLWTGFDARWGDPPAYLGADAAGTLHYPGFSAAAARWLVRSRGIAALGSDTLGVDPGADAAFAANRELLHGHRIHVENLTGLGQMPATGGWIVVGGFRARGGSGSPATVIGLIP